MTRRWGNPSFLSYVQDFLNISKNKREREKGDHYGNPSNDTPRRLRDSDVDV